MSLHFLFQLTNVSNPSLGGNDFARYCQESDELWNIHRILYRNFWPCSKLCKYNKYNLFMLSFSRPSIFNILFQRRFLSAFRGPLFRDTPSLELRILLTLDFYSFHTHVTSFTHFTLHFLCLYIAYAEYFLVPDDAFDRRKLGFEFLLLNSSSTRHIFYTFHPALSLLTYSVRRIFSRP